MSDKIRIGVLGCSAIAARSVIPALRHSEDFDVVSVGSRSPEKAERYAQRFACRGVEYSDLLADDSLDAIYVSVPVGLHYEWGSRVIQARKHLLLEKTFTDSAITAQRLIASARDGERVVMEALPYVYHPLFRRVHEIVVSCQLGAIRHLEAFFGFPHLPDGDIRYSRELGGGAILDALVYPLSFCLHLGGTNYSRYSQHVLFDGQLGIDTRGFIQVDWPEYSAQIGYGFGFMYRNCYTVWGETGCLTADRVFSRPSDLPAEIRIFRQSQAETILVEPADHFALMLDAFAQKIRGLDTSGLNEGDDIITRMAIISAIYRDCYKRHLSGEK